VNEETKQDPLSDRRVAAELRVRAALRAIQEAQALINDATQALSSVNGLCAEYEKLGRLYDAVHRTWYVVRDKADVVKRRGRLTLDHEPDDFEARWSAR
jgi:hypothetical protein